MEIHTKKVFKYNNLLNVSYYQKKISIKFWNEMELIYLPLPL